VKKPPKAEPKQAIQPVKTSAKPFSSQHYKKLLKRFTRATITHQQNKRREHD